MELFLTSCQSQTSKTSIEDDISSEVKYGLLAKIAAYDAIYGRSLVYTSHTITLTTKEEDKLYSVKGTVYAMESGNKYSTTYSGEVEYDPEDDDFDSDIDIGSFK